MTVIGNRPEWVDALLACWRIGAVALPCTEQLRPADLRARMDAAEPALVIADERDADAVREAGFDGTMLEVPDPRLLDAAPAPAADLAAGRPGADRLHLRHVRRAQADPPRPALPVRPGACRPSTGSARGAGELAWCTAASGWSKSARNSFIAPWLRGAAALLHDARFDPAERLDVVEREGVAVLCMAPTEYRAIAKRVGLRRAPGPAPRRGRRRAAEPRGRARVAGGGGRGRARRLRADRDRRAHRDAAGRAGAAGVDGRAAARLPPVRRGRRAVRRPLHHPHLLPRRPGGHLAHRRPRAARTRTATSGSRAAPTT